MEARIQLSINHQSIFLNHSPDKFSIFVVAFRIVELFEIVHPVILRVVLNVGKLACICILLHDREEFRSNLIVIV